MGGTTKMYTHKLTLHCSSSTQIERKFYSSSSSSASSTRALREAGRELSDSDCLTPEAEPSPTSSAEPFSPFSPFCFLDFLDFFFGGMSHSQRGMKESTFG